MVFFLVWVVHCELVRISCVLKTGKVVLAKSDVVGPVFFSSMGDRYPKVSTHRCVEYFSKKK